MGKHQPKVFVKPEMEGSGKGTWLFAPMQQCCCTSHWEGHLQLHFRLVGKDAGYVRERNLIHEVVPGRTALAIRGMSMQPDYAQPKNDHCTFFICSNHAYVLALPHGWFQCLNHF